MEKNHHFFAHSRSDVSEDSDTCDFFMIGVSFEQGHFHGFKPISHL